MDRERLRALVYSLLIGLFFLGVWQAMVAGTKPGTGLPGPGAVARTAVEMLANPFYDHGPNDKGIGLQFLASLRRLAIGYVAASVTASRTSSIWSIGMSMRAATPAATLRRTCTDSGLAGTSADTAVGRSLTVATYTSRAPTTPRRRVHAWT